MEPPTIRPTLKASKNSSSVTLVSTHWMIWYVTQSSQRRTSDATRPNNSFVFLGSAPSLGNLGIKRFFNLDTQVYNDGALPRKTKELLGLVASLVLRCDDCVTYHIIQCVETKVTDEEFFEAFNVGLIVGGSITIPHLRYAVDTLEECRRKTGK